MVDDQSGVIKRSIPRTFATRFRKFRMELGLSGEEIAVKLGLSQSKISRWETNHGSPNLDDIQAIINTFPEAEYGFVTRMLGLEDINSFQGISWVERGGIANISDKQLKEVNLSIKLAKDVFHEAIVKQLPMIEIQRSHDGAESDVIYEALQLAIRVGALEILDVERVSELEDKIKTTYNITNVIVARLPKDDKGHYPDGTLIRAEIVATLAAKYIPERLEVARSAIGWGSGYTLERVCQRMITNPTMLIDATWVPLMAFRTTHFVSAYTANAMCQEMGSRFYKSKAMYLPFFNDRPLSSSDREAWSRIKTTQLSTAFLSVNGANRTSKTGVKIKEEEFQAADRRRFYELDKIYGELGVVTKKKIAGEILGMFFSKDGTIIEEDETKKAVCSLGIERLKDIISRGQLVWIVAARLYKAEMVKVALTYGMANALVIDEEIARYLVPDEQ